MKRSNVVSLAVAVILASPAVGHAQDSWSDYPALDYPVARHGMVASGSNVIVFGGVDLQSGMATNKVRIFDTVTGLWSEGASLPAARSALGAGTMGGLVYAVGGLDADGNPVADTYIYDPSVDAWTDGPALSIARAGASCVEAGTILYCFGGTDGSVVQADVEILVPGQPAWQPGPAMPSGRTEAMAGVVGPRVYLAGGRDEAGIPTPAVLALDTIRQVWAPVASLPAAIADGAAGVLSGRLFCAGGVTLAETPSGSNYEYSPNLDSWRTRVAPTGILDGGRAAVVGTLLFAMGSAAASGTETLFIAYEAPSYGSDPAASGALSQSTTGAQALVERSTFPGTTLVLGAAISDPDGVQAVRLDLEVRPEGEPFSYWPTHSGLMGPAGLKSLTVTVASLGQYRWQARTVDAAGNAGPWVQFGDPTWYDFEAAEEVSVADPIDGTTDAPPVTVPAERTGGSGGSSGGCGSSAAGGQGAAGLILAALAAIGACRFRR